MATTGQDLTMYKSTHRTLRITVTGTTLSTDTTITWKLARDNASAPLVAKTLAAGTIANLQAGPPQTLDVLLYPSDTGSLPAGDYYHELRIADVASLQDVVMEGTLTLRPSITA